MRTSRLSAAATIAAVALATLPTAASADGARSDRLSGSSRIDTAVAIADAAFPDGADMVFLARSDVFADALAAGTLTGGPILLVPRCDTLPTTVREHLAKTAPKAIFALGGQGAVCEDVVDQALEAAGGASTVSRGRLKGSSRYETAAAIASFEWVDRDFDKVYLASGANTAPDAVAGGILTDGPTLLVPPPGGGPLPDVVAAFLTEHDPTRIVALGGKGAVADDYLNAAKRRADGTTRFGSRLSGSSRYETAVAVAESRFGAAAPVANAYLARADVFADAVAAGVLTDGPILLVPRCDALPRTVVDYLDKVRPARVTALGGPGAVCNEVLNAASQFVSDTNFVTLDVDGPELVLPADEEHLVQVRVTDPHVSILVHDYSQGFNGAVKAEFFNGDGKRVKTASTIKPGATSNTTNAAEYHADLEPGTYLVRVAPNGAEAGAEFSVVATSWKPAGNLKPDSGAYDHVEDRLGSGIAHTVMLDSDRLAYASVTLVRNVVDVYGTSASVLVEYPDGSRTRPKSWRTATDVSLRFPVTETGPYTVLVDPGKTRIRTEVSIDTFANGSNTGTFSAAKATRDGDGEVRVQEAPLGRWYSAVAGTPTDKSGPCLFVADIVYPGEENQERTDSGGCSFGVTAISAPVPEVGVVGGVYHGFGPAEQFALLEYVQGSTTLDPSAGYVHPSGHRVGPQLSLGLNSGRDICVRVSFDKDKKKKPAVYLALPSGNLLPHNSTLSLLNSPGYSSYRYEALPTGSYFVVVDTFGHAQDGMEVEVVTHTGDRSQDCT